MNGDERAIVFILWLATIFFFLSLTACICVGIYEAAKWLFERWKK